MASTGEVWRLGRRPALDGLRGVAILLVLAGHGWVPGGFGGAGKIGVAVFFTLSGFLITSLLLEERAGRACVNYRAFYLRRARRLLPAQLVATTTFVAFAAAFGSWWLTPQATVAAYLYLGNVHPYGLAGHFWSLAVEEQFYLVWPCVLAWLLRRRLRHLPAMLVMAGAASFGLRLAFDGVALVEQADGLLLGCALSAWLHGRREVTPPRWVAVASLAGLGALGALPLVSAETWGMSAASVLVVALIWTSAQAARLQWLEVRPLRWVGRRSYALYLWHYPVGFVVTEGLRVTGWLPFVAVVAPISLALTVASWRYVESPCLTRRGSKDSETNHDQFVLAGRVERERAA